MDLNSDHRETFERTLSRPSSGNMNNVPGTYS
jgi:hypothetical protein